MSLRAAALALVGAAALVACEDSVRPEQCFEPNTRRYPFTLPGDTTFIFRWPRAYQPIRVFAEPVGDNVQNVAAALALWVGALRCGELAANLSTDSSAADIIVTNPPQLPPPRGALLAADSVGACKGRTDGDTVPRALAGPLRAYVVPNSADPAAVAACYHFVTAHEIGHALGLLSHSADTNDLMHSIPRRRALSAADRYTIQTLYHTAPTIRPAPR